MQTSHKNSKFEEVERLLFLHSDNQIKPGLERIAKLLSSVNNPQNSFPAIHVVGTNGKGSTCAFLESIFRHSGYKTGFYSSPHLESPGERLLINSHELAPEKWLHALEILIAKLDNNSCDRTSYFELLTAAAFLLAQENNLDIGIIEAGLGGRLDATNLLGRVKCSVIASISMDHTEYLGDTLEKIAREKFAVIRENNIAVFAGNDESLTKLFREICREKNSQGLVLGCKSESEISNVKITPDGNIFDFESENLRLKNIRTNLIGAYQVYNAALALLAISLVRKSFPKITEQTILDGMKNAFWKGRFEIISREPITILDGAHNPDGVAKLTESVKELFSGEKIGLVYAAMRDKDYESCLKILNSIPNSSIYPTCVPNMKRSLESENLEKCARKFHWENSPSLENFDAPINAARKSQSENRVTIICGSLYLIGMIRKNFQI